MEALRSLKPNKRKPRKKFGASSDRQTAKDSGLPAYAFVEAWQR
jgi:hypothetical protein